MKENNIINVILIEKGAYVKHVCWFESYYYDRALDRKLFIIADNLNVKLKITYKRDKYFDVVQLDSLIKKLNIQIA